MYILSKPGITSSYNNCPIKAHTAEDNTHQPDLSQNIRGALDRVSVTAFRFLSFVSSLSKEILK